MASGPMIGERPRRPAGRRREAGWVLPPSSPVKEISLLEVVLRFAARFAAASGVIALLIWLGWVMLDVKNLQSGFTLPS